VQFSLQITQNVIIFYTIRIFCASNACYSVLRICKNKAAALNEVCWINCIRLYLTLPSHNISNSGSQKLNMSVCSSQTRLTGLIRQRSGVFATNTSVYQFIRLMNKSLHLSTQSRTQLHSGHSNLLHTYCSNSDLSTNALCIKEDKHTVKHLFISYPGLSSACLCTA